MMRLFAVQVYTSLGSFQCHCPEIDTAVYSETFDRALTTVIEEYGLKYAPYAVVAFVGQAWTQAYKECRSGRAGVSYQRC